MSPGPILNISHSVNNAVGYMLSFYFVFTMLKLIADIRKRYFPNKLVVGNCIDICILVGAILKYELGFKIDLVHGALNGCLHTWLSVNGIHIDLSTDCTTVNDKRDFVTFINIKEYRVDVIEVFDLKDFFKDMTLNQLKDHYHDTKDN